ncbi:MAG TPA: hypothetical protein VLL25_13595 [Acidimicrobiales bacterium]|nr:hypothetical protein [Acidimicrobiales bacterium]
MERPPLRGDRSGPSSRRCLFRHRLLAAYHPPATGIIQRARGVADRIGLDTDRAHRWAAVCAVGEACETWRQDSDDLQKLVTSDDEFRHLLQT